MMKKSIILIVLLQLSLELFGQANSWKRYRYEFIGGIGTTHAMTDLGGGSGYAKHFMAAKDLNLAVTMPLFHTGVRYKIFETLSTKISFSYAILKADDKYSKEVGRQDRNLHFRSNIFELTNQFEFYILKDRGTRFIMQETGLLNNISLYLIGGVGVFHFNPKAQYSGRWYELQPLGTEGQGISWYNEDSVLITNPAKYKLWSLCFPVGIGFKYNINRKLGIGFEFVNRYTTTDYIDDVGGSYFDNDLIRENYGDIAAALADRHLDNTSGPFPSGTYWRSGNDYNDAYIFFIINIYYKLLTSRRGLPKFR